MVRQAQLVDRQLGVVRREALLDPAVLDEVDVEPHVGGLVQDHVRIREIRNPHLALGDVVGAAETQVGAGRFFDRKCR